MAQVNAGLPSLTSLGVEQLYSSQASSFAHGTTSNRSGRAHATYLISMGRSILQNFVELITLAQNDPLECAEKIDALNSLFYNAHHLLNEYRPHLARERMITMMEEQVQAKNKKSEETREVSRKCEELLHTLSSSDGALNGDSSNVPVTNGDVSHAQVNGTTRHSEHGPAKSSSPSPQDRAVWSSLEAI